MRSDEVVAHQRDRAPWKRRRVEDARPHGVVDVVVEVGEPVGKPHDPALERRRDAGPV